MAYHTFMSRYIIFNTFQGDLQVVPMCKEEFQTPVLRAVEGEAEGPHQVGSHPEVEERMGFL
jgi:hypothetical protein